LNNFNSRISLSSVLIILFSITENPQLFSLHACQQKGKYKGERSTKATAWIRALACPLRNRIEGNGSYLLKRHDSPTGMTDEQLTVAVAMRIGELAKALKVHPYDETGKFIGKLDPICHRGIEPIHVICPDAVVCETMKCKPYSLTMATKPRDIPYVTLIKNFVIYKNVPVLSGHCHRCKTLYYADHERTPSGQSGQHDKVYLNSAKYLKLGQSLWADRSFTSAVLSGVYHFHASAAAYKEFWNAAFSDSEGCGNVGRRQIWQAFVQESVQTIASASNINLTLRDHLPIDEVTKEAFHILGENGLIRAANEHACKECTHTYRKPSNIITNVDASAVVGEEPQRTLHSDTEADVENSDAPVKMIVMDGIVMGHAHCAYDDCTSDLANACGGVYCALHEDSHGRLCHAAGCTNINVEGTLTCEQHQAKWRRYVMHNKRKNLGGYKRALR
jgi:hypothetical protein